MESLQQKLPILNKIMFGIKAKNQEIRHGWVYTMCEEVTDYLRELNFTKNQHKDSAKDVVVEQEIAQTQEFEVPEEEK